MSVSRRCWQMGIGRSTRKHGRSRPLAHRVAQSRGLQRIPHSYSCSYSVRAIAPHTSSQRQWIPASAGMTTPRSFPRKRESMQIDRPPMPQPTLVSAPAHAVRRRAGSVDAHGRASISKQVHDWRDRGLRGYSGAIGVSASSRTGASATPASRCSASLTGRRRCSRGTGSLHGFRSRVQATTSRQGDIRAQ